MLGSVLTIVSQILLPVFALITLGWGLRRCGVLTEAGGRDLAQLLYWVCLPAQLVLLTSRVDLAQHVSPAALAAIAVGLVLGMAGAWWASARLPPSARGCVMNGAARGNGAFIGLPVIELVARTLPPDTGIALTGIYAVLLGPSVIAFNIAAVVAFRLPHHGVTWKGIRHSLAELPRSPLIIACAVGAGLGLWHPGILDAAPVQAIAPTIAPTTALTTIWPKVFATMGSMVALLAATAVPLALIVAGHGLDFRYVRNYPRTIGWTVAAKLVVVPLLTWGVCRLLGADALTTTAATVLMASPAAIAAVPMARLLDGDAALMAALVTATTVIAPLTLLGWLLLVGVGL